MMALDEAKGLFWINNPRQCKLLCLIFCIGFHGLFKLSTVSLLLELISWGVKYWVLWEILNSDILTLQNYKPTTSCLISFASSSHTDTGDLHFVYISWLILLCEFRELSHFELIKWALNKHFQDVCSANSHSWVNVFPMQIYTAVVSFHTLCLDRQGNVWWRDIFLDIYM